MQGSVPRYFSPVQTRKQRQVNADNKIHLPTKKARQIIKNDNAGEESKTTKIQIGSATIIKCEAVPETAVLNEKEVGATAVKVEVESPNENWWQQLENVRLMRSEKPAPVDTQGCHQCADQNADEKVRHLNIIK